MSYQYPIHQRPQVTPGPIKWSRSPDGITAEQISGAYYARCTFQILPFLGFIGECDDINDVLVPELTMIATEPDSDKQELDLVRLLDLVRSNMNGFQKIMVGVLQISWKTEPARLIVEVQ